jgi:hypothetical protein
MAYGMTIPDDDDTELDPLVTADEEAGADPEAPGGFSTVPTAYRPDFSTVPTDYQPDFSAPSGGSVPSVGRGPSGVLPEPPDAAPSTAPSTAPAARDVFSTAPTGYQPDFGTAVTGYQPDFGTPDSGTPPDDGSWAVTRGLRTGFGSAIQNTGHTATVFRLLAGGDADSTAGKTAAALDALGGSVSGAPLRVPSYSDIDGISSALTWFGESLGQALGSTAPSLAGGLLGGAIGGSVGAAEGSVVPGAGTAVGGLTGAGVGSFVGAALPSISSGIGGLYGDLKGDAGVQKALADGTVTDLTLARIALPVGTVIGLIDAIPAAGFAKAFGVSPTKLGREALANLVKTTLLKRIATGAAAEGGTEAVQEVISQVTQAVTGGDVAVAQRLDRVVNALLVGAIGGAAFGGAEHAKDKFTSRGTAAPAPGGPGSDTDIANAPKPVVDAGVSGVLPDPGLAAPQSEAVQAPGNSTTSGAPVRDPAVPAGAVNPQVPVAPAEAATPGGATVMPPPRGTSRRATQPDVPGATAAPTAPGAPGASGPVDPDNAAALAGMPIVSTAPDAPATLGLLRSSPRRSKTRARLIPVDRISIRRCWRRSRAERPRMPSGPLRPPRPRRSRRKPRPSPCKLRPLRSHRTLRFRAAAKGLRPGSMRCSGKHRLPLPLPLLLPLRRDFRLRPPQRRKLRRLPLPLWRRLRKLRKLRVGSRPLRPAISPISQRRNPTLGPRLSHLTLRLHPVCRVRSRPASLPIPASAHPTLGPPQTLGPRPTKRWNRRWPPRSMPRSPRTPPIRAIPATPRSSGRCATRAWRRPRRARRARSPRSPSQGTPGTPPAAGNASLAAGNASLAPLAGVAGIASLASLAGIASLARGAPSDPPRRQDHAARSRTRPRFGDAVAAAPLAVRCAAQRFQ